MGPIGLTLDVSRMRFDDGFLDKMAPALDRALELAGELSAAPGPGGARPR